MAKLNPRYIGPDTGLRLDMSTDRDPLAGNVGPAIDMYRGSTGAIVLFVRESGEGIGKSVTLALDIEDVRAIREGCNHILVESGHEKFVQVAVPS